MSVSMTSTRPPASAIVMLRLMAVVVLPSSGLGLVTTKRPELEDKDLLKRRIEEASKYVDVDQLCLSPQCGFSSTVEGNKLTRDDQAAKLQLVVETAAEVWGE